VGKRIRPYIGIANGWTEDIVVLFYYAIFNLLSKSQVFDHFGAEFTH